MIVFHNGEWKNAENVHISPFDHGFLYGDAVYETLLVYRGSVFFIAEHFNRLVESVQALQINLPDEYTFDFFQNICKTLVQKNTLQNARLRITVSRGENHFDFSSSPNPTIIASLSPLSEYSKELFEKGVSVISVSANRIFPNIKHTNFLSGIFLRQQLATEKAFEAIYQTPEGFLREGSISNIFAVLENEKTVWIAPRTQVLAGTMQGFIETLFEKNGYAIAEKNFSEHDICSHNASLFLSNSLMGVMPVASLNGIILHRIPLFFSNIYEVLDFKI